MQTQEPFYKYDMSTNTFRPGTWPRERTLVVSAYRDTFTSLNELQRNIERLFAKVCGLKHIDGCGEHIFVVAGGGSPKEACDKAYGILSRASLRFNARNCVMRWVKTPKIRTSAHGVVVRGQLYIIDPYADQN